MLLLAPKIKFPEGDEKWGVIVSTKNKILDARKITPRRSKMDLPNVRDPAGELGAGLALRGWVQPIGGGFEDCP